MSLLVGWVRRICRRYSVCLRDSIRLRESARLRNAGLRHLGLVGVARRRTRGRGWEVLVLCHCHLGRDGRGLLVAHGRDEWVDRGRWVLAVELFGGGGMFGYVVVGWAPG